MPFTSNATRIRVVKALLVGDIFIIDANRLSMAMFLNASPYRLPYSFSKTFTV